MSFIEGKRIDPVFYEYVYGKYREGALIHATMLDDDIILTIHLVCGQHGERYVAQIATYDRTAIHILAHESEKDALVWGLKQAHALFDT